jgi:hypothetical protein
VVVDVELMLLVLAVLAVVVLALDIFRRDRLLLTEPL